MILMMFGRFILRCIATVSLVLAVHAWVLSYYFVFLQRKCIYSLLTVLIMACQKNDDCLQSLLLVLYVHLWSCNGLTSCPRVCPVVHEVVLLWSQCTNTMKNQMGGKKVFESMCWWEVSLSESTTGRRDRNRLEWLKRVFGKMLLMDCFLLSSW